MCYVSHPEVAGSVQDIAGFLINVSAQASLCIFITLEAQKQREPICIAHARIASPHLVVSNIISRVSCAKYTRSLLIIQHVPISRAHALAEKLWYTNSFYAVIGILPIFETSRKDVYTRSSINFSKICPRQNARPSIYSCFLVGVLHHLLSFITQWASLVLLRCLAAGRRRCH